MTELRHTLPLLVLTPASTSFGSCECFHKDVVLWKCWPHVRQLVAELGWVNTYFEVWEPASQCVSGMVEKGVLGGEIQMLAGDRLIEH